MAVMAQPTASPTQRTHLSRLQPASCSELARAVGAVAAQVDACAACLDALLLCQALQGAPGQPFHRQLE